MSNLSMTQESRQQLYDSLGKHLLSFEEQLQFSFSYPFENTCLRFLQNISFIGTDLCVTIRAELLCENVYARRFYLKRLWINLVEAYRALYNSDFDGQSYLSLFLKEYPQCRESEEMKLCVVKLQKIGTEIKEVVPKRNSFAHYDKDVWKTIDNLKWIDSEEYPIRLCCDLLEVFNLLLKFGGQFLLQTIIDVKNHTKTYNPISLLEDIRVLLSQREDLYDVLERVLTEVETHISFNRRVHQFMITFNKKDVCSIINVSTWIQIIRADLACALKACLVSNTQLEAMANLRMSVVSVYEGYKHLVNIYPSATNVFSMLSEDERNYNVHYRYQSNDYIPKMYQSYYDVSSIQKFLQMIDVLNELNALQNILTMELRKKNLPLHS